MRPFLHLLLYNTYAFLQFLSFFGFKLGTRIFANFHIVRNRMVPVAIAGIAVIQKFFGSNQQAAFKIRTDFIKLKCMRRHDRDKSIRINRIRHIIQADLERTLKGQDHQKCIQPHRGITFRGVDIPKFNAAVQIRYRKYILKTITEYDALI